MRYPKMNGNPAYKVSIPELSGGINTKLALNMVADNQLTDAENVWFNDGALRTRPGLATTANSGIKIGYAADSGRYNIKNKVFDIGCNFSNINYYKFLVQMYITSSQTTLNFQIVSSTDNVVTLPSLSVNYEGSGYIFDGIVSFSWQKILYVFIPYDKGYKLTWSNSTWSWAALTSSDYYIPTVSTAGTPSDTLGNMSATGTLYEPSNLLTPYFKTQFTTNNSGKYYPLTVKNIDNTEIKISRTQYNGNVITHTIPIGSSVSDFHECYCNVNRSGGYFWFSSDSAGANVITLSEVGISNNVTITCSKTPEETAFESLTADNIICNMTTCEWFGGTSVGINGGTRLFVGGSRYRTNTMHWSAAENPLYFPENNYAAVGKPNEYITAFGKQSNMLVIFKEHEIYYVTYTQGSSYTADDLKNYVVIDTEAAAAQFYLIQLHGYIGCDCPNTIQLCKNRLIWATSDGKVYTLTDNNQYSERNVHEISYNISQKLIPIRSNLPGACSVDYNNNYMLFVRNKIFILDYAGTGFSYVSSYYSGEKAQKNTTWYYWEIPFSAMGAWISNTNLKIVGLHICNYAPDDVRLLDYYRFIYTLSDNCVDKAATFTGYAVMPGSPEYGQTPVISVENQSISTMIQTKLFDFKALSQFKTVQSVFLGLGSNEENVLNVSFITERGTNESAREIVLNDPAENYSSEFIKVVKLNPCQPRTLEFGLRINSEGSMAISGMTIFYKLLGSVK